VTWEEDLGAHLDASYVSDIDRDEGVDGMRTQPLMSTAVVGSAVSVAAVLARAGHQEHKRRRL
jgi:hypothetical protein